MPHRCVFGCKTTGVILHVFPNPDKFPDRFQAWVKLAGGKLESSADYELYKKKRICDIHFTDEHRNRFKRLNALAIPTLHLSGIPGTHQTQASYESQPGASAAACSSQCDAIVPDPIVTGIPGTHQTQASYESQPGASAAACSNQFDVSVRAPIVTETPGTQHFHEVNIKNITAASSVLADHTYSVIHRAKRTTSNEDVRGRAPCYSYHYNQQMRKKIRVLQSEINRLRKRGKSFKQRLENATKMSHNAAFQTVVQNMTKPAKLLVHMQKQSVKKPKGRRYSIQEKILALSLYKKSPKCYRLLCEYFSLPSSKAMKRLLSQIKLTPGVNKIIFNKIKKTMAEKEVSDRLCSVIFDEMSITPQINYVRHADELQGFTSNPGVQFADHVLVFMAKGVKSSFKQPIAYYFTNSLNRSQLKTIIKSVIREALQAGLIVLNTVCDQSPVNCSAITELVSETQGSSQTEVIRIMGHDIIPLYDTPHLVKGLRNNLLTKDLSYTTRNEEKVIKWDYYQMVYNADKSYGELRLLDKLTEEHVTPEKINKMRVKSATQLFSHSVAVAAEHLTARGDLPNECKKIVEITLLLDNLFDSLNVSSLSIPNGKIFKGPIKKNSPHHALWQKSKEVLQTVKFIKKIKQGDKIRFAQAVVPTVNNLIKTIKGVERLWQVLSGKYRVDAMLTRNLNQDPLENFFGNIRSYGARNIAPNTVAFEGAFKALLLNNFSSPHSRRANCEKDTNECLQTLDFFLTEKVTRDVSDETDTYNFNSDICVDPCHEEDAGQRNYVCGWVLKKCLQKVVKRCQYCRSKLLDTSDNKNNEFIRAKEYKNEQNKKKEWLCYPSKELEIYFKEVQHVTTSFLKKNPPKKKLKETIVIFIETLIDFPFKCEEHELTLKNYFLDTMLNVIIYSWCRSVNRILSGKIRYDGDDETKTAAQVYYNKHKHYKNRK